MTILLQFKNAVALLALGPLISSSLSPRSNDFSHAKRCRPFSLASRVTIQQRNNLSFAKSKPLLLASPLPSESSSPLPVVFNGPILKDPSQIVTGISLGELGLDLAVAPSTVAPGQLGLYAALSEDTERTTIPALTLLCGYSRDGSFAQKDEGDKTVGFALSGPQTAVFYEKRLMSILEALKLAAETKGANQSCGLTGHLLVNDEEEGEGPDGNDEAGSSSIRIYLDNDKEFQRYFIPALLNTGNVQDNDITVQNFGQLCNDLAWSYDSPPQNKEEYDAASDVGNVVQLVWRLDFDPDTNSLSPSWPVSVFSKDVTFENSDDFMELGTRYGWNYWQATVDLENV